MKMIGLSLNIKIDVHSRTYEFTYTKPVYEILLFNIADKLCTQRYSYYHIPSFL